MTIKRTIENYTRFISQASEAARGSGPEWNKLYIAALDARGLIITTKIGEIGGFYPYPNSFPYQAPDPFPEGSEEPYWSEYSHIVWKPIIRTPEEYQRLIEEANRVAGPGDCYWCEKYLSALNNRYLTLINKLHPGDPDERYPNGYPYNAPPPTIDALPEDIWKPDTFIVWMK